MGENFPVILPKCRIPSYIQGFFTWRKSATWDRRLYFPSEGRRAEDFFALKNPTVSAGFEPANLGTKGLFSPLSKVGNPVGIFSKNKKIYAFSKKKIVQKTIAEFYENLTKLQPQILGRRLKDFLSKEKFFFEFLNKTRKEFFNCLNEYNRCLF